MNTELDKRAVLIKMIGRMSNADAQQMIAYAAGYEAGKINQDSYEAGQPRKPPKQTA